MEFWGVEVKSGQPLDVHLDKDEVLHLSQACLGEIKNPKSSESVCLHVNVNGKKLVLGTLNAERLPQQLFDLVFDEDFQLSHNWKNGSVFFYGYKADQHVESEPYDNVDSDEEEDAALELINGKPEAKKEENSVAAKKKDGKQKVTIVEPEKDESDSDDSSDDSDEDDEGSDSDEDSDEEEETPKKQSGKKRPNESAIKTPANDKKAKLSTPQKTDGKKGAVHVATPHPSKQAKTASASDGAFSCKSCNRNFKSDVALQSHNQAKHK